MSKPMDWSKLLSDWRVPSMRSGSTFGPSKQKADRSPFEADMDRIIFSAPFRRLARKTQVHPLVQSDEVHNRLTHSIEVASVGRTLAVKLARFLQARGLMPDDRNGADLANILQAACLVHDIGNPPFGHAGEYAIRAWVNRYPQAIFGQGEVSAGVRRDWELFEGNAQGFRIAARGDNPPNSHLRLTFASLGAMVKYPWDATDPRAAEKAKFNIYTSEQALFDAMVEQMGLAGPDGRVRRHPMAFLSEAADDICYRILDLEDAVEMGILPDVDARRVLAGFAGESDWRRSLPELRGLAIGRLIDACWAVFEADHDAILCGEREPDLKHHLPTEMAQAMEEVKTLYETIFAHRSKVAIELGAYKTLGRIINAMCRATGMLVCKGGWEGAGFLSQRCLELAWGRVYIEAHIGESYDWWLHQVMDFVAGLSDNHARQLSREIEGT